MTDQENQPNNQDLPEQPDPVKVQRPDVGSSPNPEKLNGDPPLQAGIAQAHQQESDMLKKKQKKLEEQKKLMEQEANKPRSIRSAMPTAIIHECLSKSFNHESIRIFCQCYFEDLYKELRELDGLSTVIRHLTAYCKEQGKTDELWSRIEEERINQYKIYHPKWEQAILENQKSQESSEDKRASDSIGQFIDKPGSITREKPLALDGEDRTHPLSGNNRAAINDWFYNELGSQEKSMVLTVALFEGINRKLMIPIFHEIERRLFEKT